MANWRDRSDKFAYGRKDSGYKPLASSNGAALPIGAIAVGMFVLFGGGYLISTSVDLSSVERELVATEAELEAQHETFSRFLTAIQAQCTQSKAEDATYFSRYEMCESIVAEFPGLIDF